MSNAELSKTDSMEKDAPRQPGRVGALRDKASDTYEAASERVRESAGQTRDAAADQVDYGRVLAAEAHDDLSRIVQRNPVMALAGAAGLGVLIGLAIKQKA
ncbi:DUF883 family protein [Pseudoponticoccus marisrubri]|uniref:DUF883 domain-containing protein n=1 Tax=Pseudoponticoccus marisrubri TaxID=1685382 RepID=A0A0W7WJ80_9RHOB|nr:DUF883 family protein [Pseudoponticoccus marisrubri]KUF10591.1 hypothetical protein AVJ23_11990 [Pseudoponticoccus marisrubri]